MENLNAEKIYKELAMFIEDMPTNLLGFKRTEKFREFLKNVLSLIKSQEQKIFDLENRIKECENGYEGTLRLDRCKLHDAEEKIKKLDVDLKAMRGAANSYKLHNKKLTEENERLRADLSDAEAKTEKAIDIAEDNIRAEIASGGTSCHWCEDKVKADTVRQMRPAIIEEVISAVDKAFERQI